MQADRHSTGMKGFVIIWLGQLVSLLGSAMTGFAWAIWAWQETGQVTALALMGFFEFVPVILVSPLAGALVDRWNRKFTMILADLGLGLSSVVALALYLSGSLEIWHLYVLAVWGGAVGSFQSPSLSAAITMMLPRHQYSRANALVSTAHFGSSIGAPILAGVLLAFADLGTVLIIDIGTFVIAICALSLVRVPQPSSNHKELGDPSGLWQEALFGFGFIFSRRSLLGLVLTFTSLNFFLMTAMTIFPAMVLARTGNNEVILGSAQSAIGLGGVAGGLFITMWGGPRRRIYGVMLGLAGASLSLMALGMGRGLAVWAAAGFCSFFFAPMLDSFAGAIYQSKVPPRLQGKFFAAGRVLSHVGTTFAYLVAGPLADHLFEPAMMPNGGLAGEFGWLVGVGSGAGMSLMHVLAGLLGVMVAVTAFLYKPIRDIEDRLPDQSEQAEGIRSL